MSPEEKTMYMSQQRSRTQAETFKERMTSEFRTMGQYRIHRKDIGGKEITDNIRLLIEVEGI